MLEENNAFTDVIEILLVPVRRVNANPLLTERNLYGVVAAVYVLAKLVISQIGIH